MQPGKRTLLKMPEAVKANGVLNSGDTTTREMRIPKTHGQNGKVSWHPVNSSDAFVLQMSILKPELFQSQD